MNVFTNLLTFLGQDKFQQFLQETPFGYFYDLHNVKIQCQLLRHIFLIESENDRDDMFIINVNGTKLHFGLKEFVAVIDLKSGPIFYFVSDPSVPNRLIPENFGDMDKVPKSNFYSKFKLENFWEVDDHLKVRIMYFILSFLTASDPSKTTIPKLYFDLVESGHYATFPWANECFNLTLKACSQKLKKKIFVIQD